MRLILGREPAKAIGRKSSTFKRRYQSAPSLTLCPHAFFTGCVHLR
jgi:hypothetical protein